MEISERRYSTAICFKSDYPVDIFSHPRSGRRDPMPFTQLPFSVLLVQLSATMSIGSPDLAKLRFDYR